MRRTFVETDDNGVVVEIHNVETKGNRGRDADEPRTKINTRKPTHKTHLSNAANKGDKWSDKHGCFIRPLSKRA